MSSNLSGFLCFNPAKLTNLQTCQVTVSLAIIYLMLDTDNLPSTNGVYLFKNKETVLYVGKSINIKVRVKSHIKNALLDQKEALIIQQSDRVDFVITDSEFNALLLESQLINKYQPKYNLILKDDKTPLYIKITIKEKYPKIFVVRRPRNFELISGVFSRPIRDRYPHISRLENKAFWLRGKEDDHKSIYFGPFSSRKNTEIILRHIRKIIPFCTDKKISNKPCFYSKVNLCNPCPNIIHKITDNKSLINQYRKNIRLLIKLLKGQTNNIKKQWQKELLALNKSKDYEKAIIIRDRLTMLERLVTSRFQNDIIESKTSKSDEVNEALYDLQKILKLYFSKIKMLHRIECYDISTWMQNTTTASQVVMTNGYVDKKEYRRFKINNQKLQSDFERLQEVMRRRLKQNWSKPDLFVVDGGRPQIEAIKIVLEEFKQKIPLIGIAKQPDRIVIGKRLRTRSGLMSYPTLFFKDDRSGLNLIRQLRDEAHRFARKYHLLLRGKMMI